MKKNYDLVGLPHFGQSMTHLSCFKISYEHRLIYPILVYR